MILLLGGTAETGALAGALAAAGYRVLVSTATEIPLECGHMAGVTRRSGPLDEQGMARVIMEYGIRAVVDCTHPYAEGAGATARAAAAAADIPYFTLIRPAGISDDGDVVFADDHREAAEKAFSFGRPVLLTTGSRNLEPYVQASGETGVALVVRVLPEDASLKACAEAGILPRNVVTGRGPFSVEENRRVIREFGIGVLVTKDGGAAGGVREKVEAAEAEGCRIVALRRPLRPAHGVFEGPSELVEAVKAKVPRE
jgi:precorrin-6A/cobalt-precorrin-6A reductase